MVNWDKEKKVKCHVYISFNWVWSDLNPTSVSFEIEKLFLYTQIYKFDIEIKL